MKMKFLALICATVLFLSGCGGNETSKPANGKEKSTIGVITHLNVSEVEYNEIMKKLEKSYRPSKANFTVEYKYFDRMNDMQMALDAKQIDFIGTYQCVAKYMTDRNNDLEIVPTSKFLEDSFCFAVREDDAQLQRQLNQTIKDMTADGTLARLAKQYITDIRGGAEPPAVPIEEIPGVQTLKVAVTGDLPPFDLVLPDGTPAGYSTAVMAEVSRRIHKNIQFVTIDSASRASVLESKKADIIFWVSVPKDSTLVPEDVDKPAGLILTDPYYVDTIAHVAKK